MPNDNKNAEIIPVSSLQKLYDVGCKKIEELLNTSVFLHNNSKYQESILFSIIAMEEAYKLDQIRKHIQLKKGFSQEEWKKITDGASHKEKLVGMYRDALEDAKSVGKENYENAIKNNNKLSRYTMDADYENDVLRVDHHVFSHLAKYNEIKKSILYFDWDKHNAKPFSLESIYDKKT